MIPLSKVLNDSGTPTPEWVRYLNLIQPDPVKATASAGVFIPSGLAGSLFVLPLTANTTIANPANMKPGQTIQIELVEDLTGGRTITLGSAYKFPAGTVPAWVTTANAINLLTVLYDGTNYLCRGDVGFA